MSIFLSYASEDANAARRVCDALRAAGLEVWFDQSELRGGDAWDASIRGRIKDCKLFVPFISANTEARSEGYFRLEWKLAVDRSHLMAEDRAFLLPVVIDATAEPSARVPDAFRERQWSRLTDDRSVAAFAERARGILAGGGRATASPAPVTSPAPAAPDAGDMPSIAVLAFANRSNDPGDEYFSDGLADELLTVLAKIRGLRVASRTSSFQFKGRHEDVSVIGRQLHVATVLEGSVRKSGSRVRITVQLVSAKDGFHLWSESYDRTLDDIFAVQDDIAQAVVGALRERLLGQAPAASVSKEVAAASRGRTDDPEAYRLYLQARFLVDRLTGPDLARSLEYVQAALERDPDFGQALALKSRLHSYEGGWSMRSPHEATALARAAALRALAIEPDLVEALLALGTLQMWHDWDWAAARTSLARAMQLAPDNADVLRDNGLFHCLVGELEKGVGLCRRSIERDPLNAMGFYYLAFSLPGMGLLQEAESASRMALELSPQSLGSRLWLAIVLERQGRPEEAIAIALQDERPWSRLTALAGVHHTLGRIEESTAALAELEAQCSGHAAFQIAQAHAKRGEVEEGFAWLERAYQQRDAGVSLVKICPWFDNLHADPRWNAFLRKVGLAEPAAGLPKGGR